MSVKPCCSKLTESVISCKDLEGHCKFWTDWLADEPRGASTVSGQTFATNKDLVYRNAFMSHHVLGQEDADNKPWFFYLQADSKTDIVTMSACGVADLNHQENKTVERFLETSRLNPRFFLLVYHRRGVMLVFVKTHNASTYLDGTDVDKKTFVDAFIRKNGMFSTTANFMADDDE